jgi:hypothetical protein
MRRASAVGRHQGWSATPPALPKPVIAPDPPFETPHRQFPLSSSLSDAGSAGLNDFVSSTGEESRGAVVASSEHAFAGAEGAQNATIFRRLREEEEGAQVAQNRAMRGSNTARIDERSY